MLFPARVHRRRKHKPRSRDNKLMVSEIVKKFTQNFYRFITEIECIAKLKSDTLAQRPVWKL